jgi:hypothetical protein
MSDRTADLTAKIERKLERNKRVNERRAEKRRKTKPASELRAEWVSAVSEEFDLAKVPPWLGADYKLAKLLVQEQGFDGAVDIVRYFISTWRERRTGVQERNNELPAMKLCWSLRGRILAEKEGVVSRPKSKREKVLRGEYDAESAAVSPSRGWGD